MRLSRLLAATAAALLPASLSAQQCDFGPPNIGDLARFDSLQRATKAIRDSTDFVVRVDAPPEVVTPRLIAALARCRLPVERETGGVIVARFPRESGLFGAYDLVVRGYVTPADGGGSSVQLYAEETSRRGDAHNPLVGGGRVSGRNHGRSGMTWQVLRLIADTLPVLADAAPAALEAGTASPFVGSSAAKVFMRRGCDLARSIGALELVVFRTEEEARRAGYARSGAPGC